MDAKFLEFYNQELKFIRESGAEFAKEYPKIAGRLGLDGFDCSDPYVERLYEGFAFLSARIHLKLDASFPDFTQHLMELLFPTFLQPIPSMLIAQFNPDYDEGSLLEGVTIKRNTPIQSLLGKNELTECEYRTAHDVTLYPISLVHAEYLNSQEISAYVDRENFQPRPKSGILIKLEVPSNNTFSELDLDTLNLHIRGTESFPLRLFESILTGFQGLMYKSGDQLWRKVGEQIEVSPAGYSKNEALLPYCNRQYDGFRLLKEYFNFANRFLFLNINHLKPTISRCEHNELQLLFLLDKQNEQLENLVSKDNFALYCSPAINLFPKRAERINVTKITDDFHVVPDKLRPLDFEVCSVQQVQGFSSDLTASTRFLPLYGGDINADKEHFGYYTLARRSRTLGIKERKFGHRSSYIGTEVHISLSDPKAAPYNEKLRQLSITTLCCNRDLPLMMPLGKGNTDFIIETGAPCESVRCVGDPTRPRSPLANGKVAWELINQLSINFLGFTKNDEHESLQTLKSLLWLMIDKNDHSQTKQIDGIIGLDLQQITRRLPFPGQICFGRGVEITITVDETAYEGNSTFMLGMLLDYFFASYVSINSFTQLVLVSTNRGEIHRWPIRIGLLNAI